MAGSETTKLMRRGILAVVAIMIGLVVTGPGNAAAEDIAPGLTNVTATISGDAQPVRGWGATYNIAYAACVPSSAVTGDSWTLGLPEEVTTWPAGFDIANPLDATDTWIEVTIANGVATFTLTETGAAQLSLCFESEFGGGLDNNVTLGNHTLELTDGGGATLATLGINVIAPPREDPPTGYSKGMWFNTPADQCRTQTTECVTAAFSVAAGPHGIVTITDTASPTFTFSCSTMTVILRDYSGPSSTVETVVPERIVGRTCSDDQLEVQVDTAGLTNLQSVRFEVQLNAVAPGGSGPATYDNAGAIQSEDQTHPVSSSITSAYVGGVASGAFIRIRKTDAAGRDANTPATSVVVPDGTTPLRFTITNTGTQALNDIVVTDALTGGSGVTGPITCTFPDGSTGTEWVGPFASAKSFTCVATLTGVVGTHENTASVSARGESPERISASDPFNAVNPPAVSVGDYVWLDSDNNGVQDAGEAGIPGVVLTITRSDGEPVTNSAGVALTTAQLSTTTDGSGLYSFTDLSVLPAGTHYVVTIDQAASAAPLTGLVPTQTGQGTPATDSSTGSAESGDLTTDGAADTTLDFGFIAPAVSVGDYVWLDSDNNGVQDAGEAGIPGVVLTITRSDGEPVTNSAGVALTTAQLSTTTDGSGLYSFTDLSVLPAGTHYVVTIDQAASAAPLTGLVPTQTGQGTPATDSSTGSAESGDLTTDGAADTTLDFGFIAPAVSVGDYVWLDSDNNGVQDAGEAGIPGVVLTITRSDGEPVTNSAGVALTTAQLSTTTDGSGLYSFTDLSVLPAGTHYVVTIDQAASAAPLTGLVPTQTGQGTPATDSSTGSAESGDLTTDGAADTTLDFGFIAPAVSVGDYVWLDSDNNGVQDAGEAGIPGVVLTITRSDGEPVTNSAGVALTTAQLSTTTDGSGLYSFTDLSVLPAGTHYVVTIDQAASAAPLTGLVPTQTGQGTPATDSSTGSAESGDLTTDGAADTTLDFGFFVEIDLSLSKQLADPTAVVRPGGEVTFVLTPRNNGPGAAIAGWSVTDILPAGLSVTAMSGTGYTCSLPTLTCVSTDGLAARTNGNPITIKATVAAGTSTATYRNVAYITPAADEVPETNPLVVPTTSTETDITATNNDAQASLTVTPAPVVPPVQAGDGDDTPSLAYTGAGGAATLAVLSLLALMMGVLLVVVSRRRGRQIV